MSKPSGYDVSMKDAGYFLGQCVPYFAVRVVSPETAGVFMAAHLMNVGHRVALRHRHSDRLGLANTQDMGR